MKRNLGRVLIALILVALLLPTFGCGRPGSGNNTGNRNTAGERYKDTNKKLSEYSPEELMEYLLDAGLEIPEGCDIPEINLKMVSHYVQELEKDPDRGYVTNMRCYHELALRVKVIVDRYYGYDDIAQQAQDMLDELAKQQ